MQDEISARHALMDPATDAATLALIVQSYPQLGPLAAVHPNAYPDLIDWISRYAAIAASANTDSTSASASAPAASAQTAAHDPKTTQPDIGPDPFGIPHQSVPAQQSVTSYPTTLVAPPATGTPVNRRGTLLLTALVTASALLVGSAAVTGTLAINRIVSASTTVESSSSGAAIDNDAATRGKSLPYTDTASGTADLAESASAETGPVVLVLDASGSMVRETSAGRSRMQDAQEAMTDAIGLLPDDAEVGLLVFGTGTGNDPSEQAAGCQDVKTAQELGPLDRESLTSAVGSVAASGFTPLGPSMRTAAGMLPADGPGTVVLVSDGVDTCSPPPACEVASELRSANPQLTIHVVGFAIDDDEEAQQQLECIGRVGGGGYVSAANVQQLGSRIARAGGTDTAAMLSDTGYRGIRLGMTLAEVEARVDGFEILSEETVDGIEYVYVDCSWGSLEFRSGAVSAISPRADASTLDGVSVGDAPQLATDVYGAPVAEGDDTDGTYRLYRISADSPYGYRIYGDGSITRVVLCACLPIDVAGGYSSWEITFDAVGPLRLGLSVDEVRALLPGAGEFVPQVEGDAATWTPLSDAAWLTLEIDDDIVTKVTVRPVNGYEEDLAQGPSLPHMRGIRVGDTMQTVYNFLPGGTTYDIAAAGIHNYAIATRTGQVVAFSPSWGGDDRLAAISLVDATRADITFPAPAALNLSGFPSELQGTWCEREDPSSCFSLTQLLSEYPNAEFTGSGPDAWGNQPQATGFSFCLNGSQGEFGCSTAETMLISYFPAGVDGDCPGAIANGWPGCENDYPHDTSEPRLVIEPNHQQGQLFWDQPPMYKQ